MIQIKADGNFDCYTIFKILIPNIQEPSSNNFRNTETNSNNKIQIFIYINIKYFTHLNAALYKQTVRKFVHLVGSILTVQVDLVLKNDV